MFAFSTFFYLKLVASGFDGVYRWVNEVDLLGKEMLLFPIHMEGHWCLATVDFKLQQFCYYDSMLGDNRDCLQVIKSYMDQRCTNTSFFNWQHIFCKDIPQQLNGSDCGVFVCMYARHLAERAPFLFSQSDIPVFRKLIVCEILNKEML